MRMLGARAPGGNGEMRRLVAVGCFFASVCLVGLLAADEVRLTPKTVVRFATLEEAGKLLGTRDEFVSRMSPFDRAVRMKTDRPVSEEQLLKSVAGRARAWEAEETDRLRRAIRALSPKLSRWKLNFPKRILMIKTAGAESGAAHTRMGAVVLPQRMVSNPRQSWERLLAHEFLHVLTRHNPDLRRSLYAVIGFQRCNEIELPEQLKARKITNPDAPWNDSYITVSVDGKPTPVVPILFSKEEKYNPRKGGGLFRYLSFRLLAIDRSDGQWKPKYRDGEPVLLDVGQVSGFYEQVGRNTGYIIHPEEIIAENFALLVTGKTDLRSPEIIRKMQQVLSGKRPEADETSEPDAAGQPGQSTIAP